MTNATNARTPGKVPVTRTVPKEKGRRILRRGWSCAAAMLMTAASGTAWAQEASGARSPQTVKKLPEVVVTATRLATPLEQVASSITVITADDIERNQFRTVPDALNAVPGLNVVASGPAGTVTSIFVRGTESNHTLVLIDGIEVNDPSTPGGAFDFAHLLLSDIERIEVLRGSQSTLYGSDAIGGVINIITRRGEGPPAFTGRLEGGSHGTFNQAAVISGAQGRFDYRLSVERFDTDGESITPARNRPAGAGDEDDGFESINASTKLGIRLGDGVRFNVIARYIDTESELDTSPEDPNAIQDTRQLFVRAEAEFALFDGVLESRLGVAYTDYDRENDDPADALSAAFSFAEFDGKKLKFDWQGDLYLVENHIVTLGLETEEEAADSSSAFSSGFRSRTSNDVGTNGAYAQLQSNFGDRLFTTVGVRADEHQRFGTEVTWRFAPAYIHRETGTKIKGSYGTGFKAPTLDQLFGASFFDPFGQIFRGNPNLQPESSRAFDVGFEQTLDEGRIAFGATYFDVEIDDLIAFNDTFSSLINLDEAETYGVEGFVSLRPTAKLGVRADYTITRSEDATTGFDLLRRPKHKASLTANYQVRQNAGLTASVVYTGRRKDIDSVTFARIVTPSYTVLNVAGSYRISETWRVFGRVNNVLDKDYQPADGFQGAGIGGVIGVQGSF